MSLSDPENVSLGSVPRIPNFMHRKLGIYACIVASIQIALYGVAHGYPGAVWLIYFDPRIGLVFFESAVRTAENLSFPGFTSVLSALVLMGVGLGLLLDAFTVGVYLVAEAILALPNVVFFCWIVTANLDPGHGFSVGELFIPGIVFIIVSVIPIWLGVRSRRSARLKG